MEHSALLDALCAGARLPDDVGAIGGFVAYYVRAATFAGVVVSLYAYINPDDRGCPRRSCCCTSRSRRAWPAPLRLCSPASLWCDGRAPPRTVLQRDRPRPATAVHWPVVRSQKPAQAVSRAPVVRSPSNGPTADQPDQDQHDRDHQQDVDEVAERVPLTKPSSHRITRRIAMVSSILSLPLPSQSDEQPLCHGSAIPAPCRPRLPAPIRSRLMARRLCRRFSDRQRRSRRIPPVNRFKATSEFLAGGAVGLGSRSWPSLLRPDLRCGSWDREGRFPRDSVLRDHRTGAISLAAAGAGDLFGGILGAACRQRVAPDAAARIATRARAVCEGRARLQRTRLVRLCGCRVRADRTCRTRYARHRCHRRRSTSRGSAQ